MARQTSTTARARGLANRGRPLKRYWAHGKGAAKIKWGIPGDFKRCVRHTRKYLGPRAEGYCANRHKQALGVWPGQEHGGRKKRHSTRRRRRR